jgi:ABC-type multidrug transport system fused ATPase/permease subunit
VTAVLGYATPREAWVWARGVLRAHRGQAGATVACFLAAAAAGLVGPQLLGALVDEVATGAHSTARIDLLAVAFLAALLVTAVLRRSARWRAGVLGEELLAVNRTQLVDRALALPLATVESVGTGALLSRATTDLDRVDSALRQGVPEVLTAVVTVVLTVVAMVLTSPLLALALLVGVPTVVLPTRWLWRRLPAAMARMLDAWAGLASRAHESSTGARTLDALGLVERRVAGDDEALVAGVDRERDLRALHVRWTPWLEISHVLPVAATLVLGAWAYGSGLASLGEVTTMVVYVQALAAPLDESLWWVEDLMIAVVALRRVLGVRVPDRTPTVTVDRRDGERGLHLDAVRFAYREHRPVLRGIDLHVAPGERLAVVGGSGAGKSTLARLIAGISAPTSGAVRLDGREVTALDDDTLRGEVLLLTQEHHVFIGSVRDNLALSAGNHGDDDLRAALELVGLGDWFTTLPDGLDTAVGSGAEPVPAPVAQQLALARVVLADPGTVVLDEATSLLDTAAARRAEGALDRVLAGRTVIAIAHRLHTAAAADRVAVMADGLIVELGPPAVLRDADGPYARLLVAASDGACPDPGRA